MRISAVVIVYNLQAYVGEAIDSVLAQARGADEIIVVDDCSTDGSTEIIRAYGSKVSIVRLPENSGALLAALAGVKAATGDVVAMLDGDDVWATNKLEMVERLFSADPELMLLSHDHVRVDAEGKPLGIEDDTHRNIAAMRRQAGSTDRLSDLLRETILDQRGYWLGSAYSFRKACFDSDEFERQIVSFGRDRLKQCYLDLVIAPFLVLTNRSGRVGYTDETRFFYRMHGAASLGGNLTPEKARQSAIKGRTINELILLILKRHGAAPAHVRRRDTILAEYDYLAALYGGEMGKAAGLYLRLAASHWNWSQRAKETQRLLGVVILGPERFLKLKSRNGA